MRMCPLKPGTIIELSFEKFGCEKYNRFKSIVNIDLQAVKLNINEKIFRHSGTKFASSPELFLPN